MHQKHKNAQSQVKNAVKNLEIFITHFSINHSNKIYK